jgi:hypothetical protein
VFFTQNRAFLRVFSWAKRVDKTRIPKVAKKSVFGQNAKNKNQKTAVLAGGCGF